MTCVENVALAIRLALEAKEAHGQVYNITNGEPKTFKYLIETTLKGLGEPIRYRKIPEGLVAGAAYSLEGVYRLFHLKAEPPLTLSLIHIFRKIVEETLKNYKLDTTVTGNQINLIVNFAVNLSKSSVISSKSFTKTLSDLKDSIVDKAGDTFNNINLNFDTNAILKDSGNFFTNAWNAIAGFFGAIWNAIVKFFSGLVG